MVKRICKGILKAESSKNIHLLIELTTLGN